jgi:hypothetical protein
MDEYASVIAYMVSEPDKGQSDAINKGFARATGDLVTWLNADDFYLPGAFEKVAEAYTADPQAPFYFGDGLRVDEAGETLSNFFPPESLRFDREALVMGLNYILQPSTFINRRSLEQVGYLDASLHYGMDSDLWMRLSKVGMPHAIPAVLSASREYGTTKTASGSFKRVEELRQISMKHSGLPITPGVLCYMLDTLLRFTQQEQGVFPPSYVGDVSRFWYQTQRLLQTYNAFPDGFPRTSARQIPLAELDNPYKSAIEQIETLTGWFRKAHAIHAELRKAIDLRKLSHDTQVAELNRLNSGAARQIETLTGWTREAREANATLQAAIDELRNANAVQVAEVHDLNAVAAREVEALTGSMREARGAHAALQEELVQQGDAHAARLAELTGVNVDASRQVEDLAAEMHEAALANATLRAALDEQKRAQVDQVAALNGLNMTAVTEIETLIGWMREAREAGARLKEAMDEEERAQAEEIAALRRELARPMLKAALGISNFPGRFKNRAPGGGRG